MIDLFMQLPKGMHVYFGIGLLMFIPLLLASIGMGEHQQYRTKTGITFHVVFILFISITMWPFAIIACWVNMDKLGGVCEGINKKDTEKIR